MYSYTLDLPSTSSDQNLKYGYKLPRSILLPPYIQTNPYFFDYGNAIDEVFDNIEHQIDAVRSIRNMWVTTPLTEEKIAKGQMLSQFDWGGVDSRTLIQQTNMLGLGVSGIGTSTDLGYKALSHFIGQYWFEKGTDDVADFLNFCLGTNITIRNCWTSDYITFLPEGDSGIGQPVFGRTFNFLDYPTSPPTGFSNTNGTWTQSENGVVFSGLSAISGARLLFAVTPTDKINFTLNFKPTQAISSRFIGFGNNLDTSNFPLLTLNRTTLGGVSGWQMQYDGVPVGPWVPTSGGGSMFTVVWEETATIGGVRKQSIRVNGEIVKTGLSVPSSSQFTVVLTGNEIELIGFINNVPGTWYPTTHVQVEYPDANPDQVAIVQDVLLSVLNYNLVLRPVQLKYDLEPGVYMALGVEVNNTWTSEIRNYNILPLT